MKEINKLKVKVDCLTAELTCTRLKHRKELKTQAEEIEKVVKFLEKLKEHNSPNMSQVFTRDSLNSWLNTFIKKLKGGE